PIFPGRRCLPEEGEGPFRCGAVHSRTSGLRHRGRTTPWRPAPACAPGARGRGPDAGMSPVMPRPPVVTGRSDAGDGLEILGSAIDADPAELRSLAQQIEATAGTVSGAAGRLR